MDSVVSVVASVPGCRESEAARFRASRGSKRAKRGTLPQGKLRLPMVGAGTQSRQRTQRASLHCVVL